MDIGDHGNGREANDLSQCVRVLDLGNGAAHHFASGRRKRRDLGDRRLDVVCLRQRHRLHDDRRAAADANVSHLDLYVACHRGQV